MKSTAATTPTSALASLRPASAIPLYQQIKSNISDQIRTGHWTTGQKLPSENELVELLNISRMTVHRALRELTLDGLLSRVHGVGTFVAEPRRHASLIKLQDIADEITHQGRSHRVVKRILRREKVNAAMARAMEINKGDAVYHLLCVHYQDDEPIQLEDRYVSPLLIPDFLQLDLNKTTATSFLVAQFKPDEMEHVVSAVLPDSAQRKALRLESNEPCLQLNRRTWKNHQVVTRVSMTYPGNRYELAARYRTDQPLTL